MNLSRINKKILIFGFIFILFTVFVAFYLKREAGSQAAPSDNFMRDYEVSGNVLKSKKAGFSLEIPESWIVKNYDSKITLLNSEIQGLDLLKEIEDKEICMFNVQIAEYKQEAQELIDFQTLIKEIEAGIKGKGRNFNYILVNIEERVFVETIFEKEGKTFYISAKTLNNSNIYYFNSGLIFSEKCAESFNNILNTIIINYNK